MYIGLEKSGYQVNIFLISPRKYIIIMSHMSTHNMYARALQISTHNIFLIFI